MLKLKHLDRALAHEHNLRSAARKDVVVPRRTSGAAALVAAVTTALQDGSRGPLDAYSLAKATGWSVMDCGRALLLLEAQGDVRSADPSGTENDLARRFCLTAQV